MKKSIKKFFGISYWLTYRNIIEDAGIAQTGAQTPVKRMIHKALDVLLSFLRIFISIQSKVLLIQTLLSGYKSNKDSWL